jgi:hypothetical protein
MIAWATSWKSMPSPKRRFREHRNSTGDGGILYRCTAMLSKELRIQELLL